MTANPIVLIVDDQLRSREALASLLEPEGYRMAFAANGLEAIAQARAILPDLVLLDVMMPEMDGFEVCRHLRSDPALSLVPIVMVTALDGSEALLRGLEAGADDFISKPFNRTELRARVRTITRLNRYRTLVEERRVAEQRALKAARELEEAYNALLEGWSRALDLRDHETEGHSRRVTEMSVRLARAIGITGEDLENVRRGALLHDIGKMGIPDAILRKPGPLTAEEWDVMRQHPQMGFDLLSQVSFLHKARDIVLWHHEKWDGTGYPHKLHGDTIPLAARIFAVVDVWDALSNDRPYRKASLPEEVRAIIRSLIGTHFDPYVAETFLQLITPSQELPAKETPTHEQSEHPRIVVGTAAPTE